MKKAVLFIDGNNIYHNLSHMGFNPNDLDFQKFAKAICDWFKCETQEVRYYNSMPSQRDGKELYLKHLKFIDELRKIPNFTIRTRHLQVHSTAELLDQRKKLIDSMKLCKNCKQVVEHNLLDSLGKVKKREKGIDVMIAVDLMEYAIDKKSEILIVVSGDADFVPAMELAKKRGAEVFSASVRDGYSAELRAKFPRFIIFDDRLNKECSKS